MLIEFRVENHRSIRDEQVLTMETSKGPTAEDPRPRVIDGNSDPVLPVAVLYGANGSGKSNVLSALDFMRAAVVDSHRVWPPEPVVPRESFGWGPSHEKPSFFEATFVAEGVRYEYGFEATDERFTEEWLYAWPNGKKQVWYERNEAGFDFGDSFRGENKLIEDVTRPNALFLSVAAQHRHSRIGPIYNWFRSIRTMNVNRQGFFNRLPPSLVRRLAVEMAESPPLFDFDDQTGFKDRFRQMIQKADFGIVDFRIVKPDPNERYRGLRIELKHKSSSEEAWLPLEEESKGTQTLLGMAYPIIQSLRSGTLLVVDELESSLHPMLAQEIVRWFNDPATNPQNAQLLFTTHDTNLMGTVLGEPAVRRDQVWLTEKDDDGGTVLYPLTDYKPRKQENLEHGYLQGRYGAVPFLGDFRFLTENLNESPQGATS